MGEVFNAELAKSKPGGVWETLAEEARNMSTADRLQVGTDVVGLFDPTPVSGVASTALSVFRGDFWGVALGIVGLVPYLGDAAKLGKIAKLAPKTAMALEKMFKAGEDFAKMGKDSLKQFFKLDQIVAARRKAAEAVRKMMRNKRLDPKCTECAEFAKSRMPRGGPGRGKWNTADGKAPANGNGTFEFETPKKLPNGEEVKSIEYKDGYPDFDKYVNGGKHDIYELTGDAVKDARSLEKEMGIADPGKGYTLHHFEDGQVGRSQI